MARISLLFLSLLSVCFVLVSSKALTVKSRVFCCSFGANYSTNGLDCKSLKPPTSEIEAGEETACAVISEVCCKKQFKILQCDLGKSDAKAGSCSRADGDRKECCSACLVGIDLGRAGEPCIDSIGLGSPFDKTFISCCEEAKAVVTTPSSTSTTKAVSSTAELQKYSKPSNDQNLPGLSDENVCETSEYCAQLCKTTAGGTYECACFTGFVLMEDGVSCKPVKRDSVAAGRCQENNPCDHECIDTGTQIKCSCRTGYELAADKRTCKDIDECALNLHDCTSTEECVNDEGTYDCYDPSLSPLDYDSQPQCPTGYKFNGEKQTCDDINECEFGIICAPPKVCKNSIGSFTCEGEDEPQCPPGFHYKSAIGTCADIDECITGENNCNKESQVCLNTKGNFTCVEKASHHSCPAGFKKNIVTGFCEDIDECMDDDSICKPSETCVNEEGGHTCVPSGRSPVNNEVIPPPVVTTTTPKPVNCPRGYKFVRERNTCDDIDECTETSEPCDSSSTCVNIPGSYNCLCKVGFQKDPITGACEDINECALGHNCGVGQRCDNTPGSYLCTRIYGCGTGYTLNHASGLCEDDDECRLGTHTCNRLGSNFKCRNLLGSYRCDFVRPVPSATTPKVTPPVYVAPKPTPPVYLPPVYVPPKPAPPAVYAAPSTTSSSTTSSTTPSTTSTTTTTTTTTTTERTPERPYRPYYATPRNYYPPAPVRPTPPPQPASQPPRYPSYTRATQRTYPDTPPIPLYQNTTPANAYSPTPPTVRRDPPRPPYYNPFPPQNTIIGQRKQCLPGYVMNYLGDCEDVDECLSNPCPRNTKCINFNGRFECASPMQCKMGYELNDDGDQCVDVNECSRGTHECHYSQICKNGPGYYTCECPAGHHLVRSTNMCEDIDECRIYRPCGSNSECFNTRGSYQCSCKDGFKKSSDSLCEDVDECADTPGLCEHTCVNTYGSYRCACQRGFRLNLSDNRTCTDRDECEEHKNTRLCVGYCQNVPGSYKCVCPPGYKLGSDGRICLDIDECQSKPCGDESENACLNTRGSYKCFPISCPANYIKDPDHKSRCKRTCDPRDTWCLLQPDQYTYQFVALSSDLPVNGKVQLFQIKGPQWAQATADFSMKVLEANAPPEIEKVSDYFFQKVHQDYNSMSIFLVRSIKGPQEVKLQLEMKLYDGRRLMGSTVIYIYIVVSEYTF